MRLRLRRLRAAIFAGDRRVWATAAAVGLPLFGLIVYYALKPRDYYTGTNSVEVYTYVAPSPPHQPVCIPGLLLPPGTRRIQFQVVSQTAERPMLRLRLTSGTSYQESALAPQPVSSSRISVAVFPLGQLGPSWFKRPARACLTAAGLVNWGGTPLPAPPRLSPPTLAGAPLAALISVWYLPSADAKSSYVSRLDSIFQHASLFRPGFAGAWLYWLIFIGVLPLSVLAALRVLASAAMHERRAISPRRTGLVLFTLAAVNFACWALITPAFHAPDEVDHFAYTQSLVERGEQPAQSPASPLVRWSRGEGLALEEMSFATDHQIGDTRVPWDPRVQSHYRAEVATTHPRSSDGGGNETAATHGPVYYALLAPAYLVATSSPFSQLTLMRLTSALLGALSVLFAFLLGRELAPQRPWLGVVAALLVAFQPMYGFISGAVNNDVGVNAATAGLELLTILIVRHGWRLRYSVPIGLLLLVLPAVKETGLALYPAVGLALLGALWRHHRRADLRGLAALGAASGVAAVATNGLKDAWRPMAVAGVGVAATATVSSSVSEALAHPLGYLAYLWEIFLPRLPFMARHFVSPPTPGFVIYVERGWGAFGWYVVLFPHWVFEIIFVTMLAVGAMAAASVARERIYLRAHLIEAGFIVLCPIAIVAGVEAAFYTVGVRPVVAEFGRYVFPAIVPLALLVVGATHAFGRRHVLWLGTALVTATMALSLAGQLLELTRFYA